MLAKRLRNKSVILRSAERVILNEIRNDLQHVTRQNSGTNSALSLNESDQKPVCPHHRGARLNRSPVRGISEIALQHGRFIYIIIINIGYPFIMDHRSRKEVFSLR